MITVLLFDWGGTVMRNFGEYQGPMARWPRVEAVPGVQEALAGLHNRYRLALATNAMASGEELVREALGRVHLEVYFDDIFTARELGALKPSRDFFEAVLGRVGCLPREVAMIGDDYELDILAAKKAGLWAVWLNPVGGGPESESRGTADVEFRSFMEFGKALEVLLGRVGGSSTG